MDRNRPRPLLSDRTQENIRGRLHPEIEVKQEIAILDKVVLPGKKTSRKHERMIYDSSRGKPYKKEKKMGIEGIEELSGNQGDPGDEQTVGQPEHVRQNMEENGPRETPLEENAPETDAHPGEPGDGGHEVSTETPDDPTQPDQTNEPTDVGQPAEGLQAESGPTGDPAEGLDVESTPDVETPYDQRVTPEEVGLLPDATPEEISEAVQDRQDAAADPPTHPFSD